MHSNYNPSMNSGSPFDNPSAQQASVFPGGRTKNTGYAAQLPGSIPGTDEFGNRIRIDRKTG